MLRMSRDQVAPMKTPSIWKASTPRTAGAARREASPAPACRRPRPGDEVLRRLAHVLGRRDQRHEAAAENEEAQCSQSRERKTPDGGDGDRAQKGARGSGADGAPGKLLGGGGEAVEEISAEQEEVHQHCVGGKGQC